MTDAERTELAARLLWLKRAYEAALAEFDATFEQKGGNHEGSKERPETHSGR